MEIWINPACSKCRTATAALDEAGIDYTVRRYLDEWIAAMVEHPKLIQRPIITADDGATVIGRDAASLARITGKS